MTHPTIERVDNRYEIRVDGEPAGFTEFRDRDVQRVFFHTEIAETLQGKGLSSVLIEHALTHTRQEGKRVIPVCPAVSRYLAKHHEFTDVTDPADRDVLTWLTKTLQ
jgi:predicted GNAT family acetyltransferase